MKSTQSNVRIRRRRFCGALSASMVLATTLAASAAVYQAEISGLITDVNPYLKNPSAHVGTPFSAALTFEFPGLRLLTREGIAWGAVPPGESAYTGQGSVGRVQLGEQAFLLNGALVIHWEALEQASRLTMTTRQGDIGFGFELGTSHQDLFFEDMISIPNLALADFEAGGQFLFTTWVTEPSGLSTYYGATGTIESFQLYSVPEPSHLAFGLLASFCLFRMRRVPRE